MVSDSLVFEVAVVLLAMGRQLELAGGVALVGESGFADVFPVSGLRAAIGDVAEELVGLDVPAFSVGLKMRSDPLPVILEDLVVRCTP